MNEFERQGKKGTYIEWDEKIAPRIKIKSSSANAPKCLILKSKWRHPDYYKLQKNKVTKTKMINLLGETPKEEKRRLLKQKIFLIRKRKSPIEIKDKEIYKGGKGYLIGTTPYQRKRRRLILVKKKSIVPKTKAKWLYK